VQVLPRKTEEKVLSLLSCSSETCAKEFLWKRPVLFYANLKGKRLDCRFLYLCSPPTPLIQKSLFMALSEGERAGLSRTAMGFLLGLFLGHSRFIGSYLLIRASSPLSSFIVYLWLAVMSFLFGLLGEFYRSGCRSFCFSFLFPLFFLLFPFAFGFQKPYLSCARQKQAAS